MKKTIGHWLNFVLIIGIVTILALGCNKDDDINESNVKDIDGNIYRTVTIGTQVWMAENLKTTKYRDGTPITHMTSNSAWGTLSSGAYCWYNNDATSNKETYGALYNWYAIKDSHNLAPKGWHVATYDEWLTLKSFLGEKSLAGGKLKEIGTIHWLAPNKEATNEVGFSALPGGMRSGSTDGSFSRLGFEGNWWPDTPGSGDLALSICIRTDSGYLLNDPYPYYKRLGFSVRCVKD